jgi:hypothetical protein
MPPIGNMPDVRWDRPMRAAKPGLGQGSPAGKTAQAAPDSSWWEADAHNRPVCTRAPHPAIAVRDRAIFGRACLRALRNPGGLTFGSRPPGPGLVVTTGSRSAEPEVRGQRNSGLSFLQWPARLAPADYSQQGRCCHLYRVDRRDMLVSLIVVLNPSGSITHHRSPRQIRHRGSQRFPGRR